MDKTLHTRISYLLLSLSRMNFDYLFFRADTGESVPFQDIFPVGIYSIVGNSSLLLNSNQGKEIDQSDYVIRFDHFKTEKKNLGEKINIWIMCSGTTPPQTKTTNVYITTKYKSFQQKKDYLKKNFSEESLSSFIIFHDDHVLKTMRISLQIIPSINLFTLLILSVKYKHIKSFGMYNQNDEEDNKKDNKKEYDWSKEQLIYYYLVKHHFLNIFPLEKHKKQKELHTPYSIIHPKIPRHINQLYQARHVPSRADIKINPSKQIKTTPKPITITETNISNDTNKKLKDLIQLITHP